MTKIFDNVVKGLLQSPRRRFNEVEMGFFIVWLERHLELLDDVKKLVANKQLAFLNGGWSMHDEAGDTFVDMLDNTHVGQRAIVDYFGVSALPTMTWQIGA